MSSYTDADVQAAVDAKRALWRMPRDEWPDVEQEARASLDAVAPLIAARALREFADTRVREQTAARMAEDLHARADEIEASA